MIEAEQKLLAQVLDLFARKFHEKAVLRGGMVLRVLGSPRLTNDLDYVFVPYKSKNDIVDEILSCLGSIPGANVHHTLNSKCLRVVLSTEAATIQIEAKTAMDVLTSTVSSRLFSLAYNLPPRLIHVVDMSVALADKLAAWNERRLIRDLYDIWFFMQMQVQPDLHTLAHRLRKPVYSRLVDPRDYFMGDSPAVFFDFIRAQSGVLTDLDFTNALSDYLPAHELIGMGILVRAALVKLEA